jgi:transposase
MYKTGYTLGLDVSKLTIDACLLGGDRNKSRTQIPNNHAGFQQLMAWLNGIDTAELRVCLEPTGRYSRPLSLFLHQAGFKVSQVNSYAVLHHGRSKGIRSKNDRIDAFLLADYCMKEEPPEWFPPDQAQAELRELQGRLDALDECITQEKNRLQSGITSQVVRQDIEEHLAQLLVRRMQLEHAAKALVQTDPTLSNDFAILKSVIGLGEKSVIRLLALVQFRKFKAGRQTACFAGLTPRQYESGTSVHKKEHISRRGSSELREALYFPAMVAIQHNPQLRAFADRLKERGKPPKVVICAVMRKLLVLATALINKQEFYDSQKGAITN